MATRPLMLSVRLDENEFEAIRAAFDGRPVAPIVRNALLSTAREVLALGAEAPADGE